jgi:hypothetical protein
LEGEPLNTWALTFYAELLTHKFGKVIVNARKVHTLPPEGFANPHAIAAKALEATSQPEQALAEYQLDLKETDAARARPTYLRPSSCWPLVSRTSAMILAGPRVYFALAREGLFLPAAAKVHPRYRTPAVSVLAQAMWSGILVVSGTFEQLLTYTGFAVVLFAGIAVLALFVLRRKRPMKSPRSADGGIRFRPPYLSWLA